MTEIIKNGTLNWVCNSRCLQKNCKCIDVSCAASCQFYNNSCEIFVASKNSFHEYPSIINCGLSLETLTFTELSSGPKCSTPEKAYNCQALVCCDNFVVAATPDKKLLYWDNKYSIKYPKDLLVCDRSNTVYSSLIDLLYEKVTGCRDCINNMRLNGIACIEYSKIILFGFNHIGCDKCYANECVIIQASYVVQKCKKDGDTLCIKNDFALSARYEFEHAAKCEDICNIKSRLLRMCDICYNPDTLELFILTNYKYPEKGKYGGFIWKVRWYEQLGKLAYFPSILLCQNTNEPYEMTNVPKGIAYLNDEIIMVVFDKSYDDHRSSYSFEWKLIKCHSTPAS